MHPSAPESEAFRFHRRGHKHHHRRSHRRDQCADHYRYPNECKQRFCPSDISVPVGILLGDTSGNGSVNASDASQTKSVIRSGGRRDELPANDVNVNNSINASDVSLAKSKSGTALSSPALQPLQLAERLIEGDTALPCAGNQLRYSAKASEAADEFALERQYSSRPSSLLFERSARQRGRCSIFRIGDVAALKNESSLRTATAKLIPSILAAGGPDTSRPSLMARDRTRRTAGRDDGGGADLLTINGTGATIQRSSAAGTPEFPASSPS